MRFSHLLLAAIILANSSGIALAQLTPEKAAASFKVSEGLEVTLWAAEPLFSNPTCMDIDERGRIWVCESVNYRDHLHGRPLRRPEGDRILILEDSKGAGKADRVTTFYQAKEMLAPLGIAVAKDPVGPGYKVYIAQSPDILVFEDKNGLGHADGPPRKLLSGFRGIDHDHGVHGLLIGPDRKLYFSVGDQGVAGLPGKNGKRYTTNHTDCQGGTIWRCELDGSNLELLAHNFRNEYEPCVDSFGTIFVSDNDDDGNQQTRICYVMPGGNYGYWPRGPGQSHWHEEQPGIVPKILRTYFGSPTGMCVYEGALLPEKYRGQLLHTDAGPRQVRCYHLREEGASYRVDREDMVTSSDPWFRPSDICVAPDGSVFVCDWYDPGVGGHGMGDVTRGRIYRIAPPGYRPKVLTIDLSSNQGLLDALNSPALAVRYMAMEKVAALPTADFLGVVEPAIQDKQQPSLRARALWQLGRKQGATPSEREHLLQVFDARIIRQALTDADPRFRCVALRIIHDCQGPETVAAQIALLLKRGEACAAVKREALLCLRDCDTAVAKPLIAALAKDYDGKDRFYLEALGIAVGHESERREIVLRDFVKDFPAWNEQLAGIVWELNPPGAEKLLEANLHDDHLSIDQRLYIIGILANSPSLESGDILLRLLTKDAAKPVQERAVECLQTNIHGKWNKLRGQPLFASTVQYLLESKSGHALAMTLMGVSENPEYVQAAAAIALSKTEELPTRMNAIRALGALPGSDALDALSNLVRTAGLESQAIAAIGMHAQQRRDAKEVGKAVAILGEIIAMGKLDESARRAALSALAGSRAGTVWLLEQTQSKSLPPDLLAEAGRLLRNSPFRDLRQNANAELRAQGRMNPKKLPSIASLQTRHGNPARGKQLIAASIRSDLQCLKCHTIGGQGGKVGPDLSTIGKKASRENLLESILYPSKAIADQYIAWTIETKSGLFITGLLVEETPAAITLRDANGKDHRIEKSDVEARGKSPNSIMANDLAGSMSEQDLADIVEFLLQLK
jgi:putative membrane-bound dehydrogenase-like protein